MPEQNESMTSAAQLIFIVDGDEGMLRRVDKALRRAGFATAGATTGQAALEWLATHHAGLMLLDAQLPGLAGTGLVPALEQRPRVPFIIITARGDQRAAVEMMKRGALDYVVKDAGFLDAVPEAVRRALALVERDQKLAEAEAALRRSEANLAKAQQIAHIGSYEVNIPFSGNDYRSAEIYRIIGLDPRELSTEEYARRVVHPEDQARYRQVIEQTVQRAVPFDFEYRIVRPDGSVRHVQSIGEPVLDGQGRVVKLVGTLMDLTQRKHTEEALKKEHAFLAAILDTSGALVVVLDREGRIIRFNTACEHATGYAFDEVRGQPFWERFLPPEELASVKTVFRKLCSGQFPSQHENDWLTRDGSRRRIAWSNTALLDSAGAVEFVIAVGIDITERKRLEREILEISDREQRRIGQDLHDGLGQHLAATELMSQVLEQRLEVQAKEEAAQAAEIARHVRAAISQTRSLARGLSPVTLESEGLMSALRELAATTEEMFHVNCRFDGAAPVRVRGDAAATHLFRIAQEAVSNAIKHGKAKHIVIQARRFADHAALVITDDGVGFPRKVKKTGMGLRIMHYRAGMIGAALRIEPAPDHGTTVVCAFKHNL